MLTYLLDASILLVLALSTYSGFYRGFFSEILTIVTWVVSPLVAYYFHPFWDSVWVSLIIICIGAMILAWLLKMLFRLCGLQWFNRILGLAFGILRTLVLLVLFSLLAQHLHYDDQRWYQDSRIMAAVDQRIAQFTHRGEQLVTAVPEYWVDVQQYADQWHA